jgi:hypothetical protein
MPSPCTVCMHPDRAGIDRRLACERVNLAGLAYTLGVGRKALERHRARHVPSVLAKVHAEVAAESASPLLAEIGRLYDLTLDALAESATLSHIDSANGQRPTASHAAIAGLVNDARQHVGTLTQLFLETAHTQQHAEPTDSGIPIDGLLARINAQLERVMPR